MSIELSNEWVLCHSKCGNYKGYFKSAEIPPDYVENNKVFISQKEFMYDFDFIDTCFDRSWEQNVENFKKKHAPLVCEFEAVVMSKETFKGYVINALLTDIDRLIVCYGYEYEDWYYIESILKRRDFFSVETDNSYCVDDVLSELGLPSLKELYEYSTESLSCSVDNNDVYSFKLSEL